MVCLAIHPWKQRSEKALNNSAQPNILCELRCILWYNTAKLLVECGSATDVGSAHASRNGTWKSCELRRSPVIGITVIDSCNKNDSKECDPERLRKYEYMPQSMTDSSVWEPKSLALYEYRFAELILRQVCKSFVVMQLKTYKRLK